MRCGCWSIAHKSTNTVHHSTHESGHALTAQRRHKHIATRSQTNTTLDWKERTCKSRVIVCIMYMCSSLRCGDFNIGGYICGRGATSGRALFMQQKSLPCRHGVRHKSKRTRGRLTLQGICAWYVGECPTCARHARSVAVHMAPRTIAL